MYASKGSQSNGFEEMHHSKQIPVMNSNNGKRKEESRKQYFLESFSLFKTRTNFYLVGRDRGEKVWRVLKIDRSQPSELVLYEDPTEYSWSQCSELLQRIDDGNRHVGGRKFVSTCYGIIGFIKFLAPYYMLLITKRKKLGEICGHPVYGISKYKMIQIPHRSVRLKVTDEDRYRNLLGTVDLTKDFYYSTSYPLMHTLQRNICRDDDAASMSHDSNFVWNEFLTREIRNHLRNTLWTVALVHGFFKQAKLSTLGCQFYLTLLARRSRQNAGTRYLKRGVNGKGEAANDVETEQIVCQKISDGHRYKISSHVQNRGSIPLVWFQRPSWLNLKPDILLANVDRNYRATELHFEELTKRYGNPIVIFNLVKSREKKPRETVLSEEFVKAVNLINNSRARKELLEFKSLDLNGHFKTEGTSVLTLLDKMAEEALDRTGFFSYEVAPQPPPVNSPQNFNMELSEDEYNSGTSVEDVNKSSERECRRTYNLCKQHSVKPQKIQNGVVRTNCIDCIDRTNIAQFAQGVVALSHQLMDLGFPKTSEIDSGHESLMYGRMMEVYKEMGDALAWQYGGSAARCKIFSAKRGEWNPATNLQEIITTLQRYFSNVYMDMKKQNGINLFLGYFRPGLEQIEMMVLGSDHSYDVEGLISSNQNNNCSSSLRSHAEKINCFLCEGMSYRRTPTSTSSYSLRAFTTEAEIYEASISVATSASDVISDRYEASSISAH